MDQYVIVYTDTEDDTTRIHYAETKEEAEAFVGEKLLQNMYGDPKFSIDAVIFGRKMMWKMPPCRATISEE